MWHRLSVFPRYLSHESYEFDEIWCAEVTGFFFWMEKWRKIIGLKIQNGGWTHLENRFSAISQCHIVRLMQNLLTRFCYQRLANFENSRWQTVVGHHENVYISISQPQLLDLDKIWCADAHFILENCHMSSFTILASFISPQWVKPCLSHFTHTLPCLVLPWC